MVKGQPSWLNISLETAFPTSCHVMFGVHQDNAGTSQKPHWSLSAVLTTVPMLLWGSTFSGSRQRTVVLLFSAFPKRRSRDGSGACFYRRDRTQDGTIIGGLVWLRGDGGASRTPDSTKEWQESTIWSSSIGKSGTVLTESAGTLRRHPTAFTYPLEPAEK